MRIALLWVLVAGCFCVSAQELIINGDFEQIDKCPVDYIKRYTPNFIPGWHSPTTGTPDVYNRCSKTGAGVPYNWAGIADAQSGDGYVGILIHGHNEFIKTKLASPLIRDKEYVISFYHRLSSYSMLSADRIAIKFEGPEDVSYMKEYIKEKSLDSLTGSWELVQDTIRARGGEEFLTIGNFDIYENKTRTTNLFYREGVEKMLSNHSYYYVDNVSLQELAVSQFDTLTTGVIYTFSNLLFDFDQAILADSSLEELNTLAAFLEMNPDLQLEVYGHTDETGDQDYNLNLSVRRAQAVVNYLKSWGIGDSRLKFEGFGESRPLKNIENKGGLLNRRVEFQLISPKSN